MMRVHNRVLRWGVPAIFFVLNKVVMIKIKTFLYTMGTTNCNVVFGDTMPYDSCISTSLLWILVDG